MSGLPILVMALSANARLVTFRGVFTMKKHNIYDDWPGLVLALKLNYEITPLVSKTSLLRRLQAQTLPDAASPIGKVHPFKKIALNQ